MAIGLVTRGSAAANSSLKPFLISKVSVALSGGVGARRGRSVALTDGSPPAARWQLTRQARRSTHRTALMNGLRQRPKQLATENREVTQDAVAGTARSP